MMLQAVAQSFVSMPLGAPLNIAEGSRALLVAAQSIFVTGVQFAAPVIAAILIMNLALAILGRAAPQLNIMSLAFPLQIGVGLLTFAGSLALVVNAMSDWTPGFATNLENVGARHEHSDQHGFASPCRITLSGDASSKRAHDGRALTWPIAILAKKQRNLLANASKRRATKARSPRAPSSRRPRSCLDRRSRCRLPDRRSGVFCWIPWDKGSRPPPTRNTPD
jgi:flagellar biosynthesis protein FliQ